MPAVSEGRLRLRIVQAAIVISVVVGGVLLWYQDHERSQHQQRMQQIEQLREEAQRQQAFSDQLLINARDLLKAVEAAHQMASPASEPQHPALEQTPPAPTSQPTDNRAPDSPPTDSQPMGDAPLGPASQPASADDAPL